MAYIFVNSFKRGLDARRSRISATQGTLVRGENIHINRGGEIEKRKAFVLKHALPAGQTFGLHGSRLGLYVFGSDAAGSVAIPPGVRYQQLAAPSSAAMVEVISSDSFNGVPYVVARFADGSIHHFWNGVRVTDWDVIAPEISDLATLGQKFADLVNTDLEASAIYSLILGVDTITITGNAVAVSLPITASVQNSGAENNQALVTITQGADATHVQEATVELIGGYTPATDANDAWEITVNGRSYRLTGSAAGVGSTARTFRGKVYATVQGLLYFSDAQNPTRWTTTYVPDPAFPLVKVDTFAGFESVASQTSSADSLITTATYQNHLAVFSRRNVQIWAVVPGDPKDNAPVQILDQIGTMAPRSAVSFGQLDVFFLADSGIRSLRARDASNAAVVFDVGTAIDPLVRAHMDTLTEAEIERAVGAIEPRDGRYMLAIGSKVFVYSFYPASDISAWSTYEPGFAISDFAVREDQFYARSGDSVYLLGGDDGNQFDESMAWADISWLDAEKPAHRKRFTGLDVSCEGSWSVSYNTNPNTEDFTLSGHLTGQNFSLPAFAISGTGTHVAFRFQSNDAAPARLSSSAVHFDYTDPPK